MRLPEVIRLRPEGFSTSLPPIRSELSNAAFKPTQPRRAAPSFEAFSAELLQKHFQAQLYFPLEPTQMYRKVTLF